MTPAQIQLMLNLIALCLQYGIPAITSAIASMEKENITLEDIQALRNLVKPPESY